MLCYKFSKFYIPYLHVKIYQQESATLINRVSSLMFSVLSCIILFNLLIHNLNKKILILDFDSK